VIADRKDKRHIVLATQSCLMVLALVLAGLTATGWVRTWHVAVVAAMTGLVMAFDMPARQAFVVEMVGRSELMNAIALNSSIFNSARIFGPAIAGVVVAGVGMAWCFFINGLSFLAVLVGLLLMRFPPRKREAKETGVLAGALDGVHFLRRHPRVSGLVTLLGVFSIFGWSYSLLMPIFARDILHSGPQGLGMLMTANGTGALVGALLVASLTYYPGRARILFAGGFLFSVAISGFAFSRLFLLSAFLLALAGLGGVSLMSTANTMIQISVPDELRGRIMGVWALVFAGSAPVGSFQAGTVAHYLGAPRAVLIGATITAIATVSALLSRGRMRRQQTAAHIE
jgi:MFS family permease